MFVAEAGIRATVAETAGGVADDEPAPDTGPNPAGIVPRPVTWTVIVSPCAAGLHNVTCGAPEVGGGAAAHDEAPIGEFAAEAF
jgi:hypothetical protein